MKTTLTIEFTIYLVISLREGETASVWQDEDQSAHQATRIHVETMMDPEVPEKTYYHTVTCSQIQVKRELALMCHATPSD